MSDKKKKLDKSPSPKTTPGKKKLSKNTETEESGIRTPRKLRKDNSKKMPKDVNKYKHLMDAGITNGDSINWVLSLRDAVKTKKDDGGGPF